MKSLPDWNTAARHRWLTQEAAAEQECGTQEQSDFEQSLAFRLTLIVAVFVIGINVFQPAPAPLVVHTTHATV
ncbi:hypothetical protein BCh11DRAFT_00275 [Burkholderia sp. Ch1-1]|nr:hypothetical protein BCh11DRAFT_00275 [Burkholderia sp. Ch1-1]